MKTGFLKNPKRRFKGNLNLQLTESTPKAECSVLVRTYVENLGESNEKLFPPICEADRTRRREVFKLLQDVRQCNSASLSDFLQFPFISLCSFSSVQRVEMAEQLTRRKKWRKKRRAVKIDSERRVAPPGYGNYGSHDSPRISRTRISKKRQTVPYQLSRELDSCFMKS